MDAGEKFSDHERRRVIEKVQERFGITLRKHERRQKWWLDEKGKNYWVLGGRAEWHGIPSEMMDDEIDASIDGMLVIAQKNVASIEAFAGTLAPLVAARDKLYLAKGAEWQYHFTVKIQGAYMQCLQVPSVVLKRFATFQYSTEDLERDRKIQEAIKQFRKLSPEKRAEVLKTLQAGGATTGEGG